MFFEKKNGYDKKGCRWVEGTKMIRSQGYKYDKSFIIDWHLGSQIKKSNWDAWKIRIFETLLEFVLKINVIGICNKN